MSAQTPENDAVTYAADDMKRAWDQGYRTGYSYRGPLGEGAGNPLPENPYARLVTPVDGVAPRRHLPGCILEPDHGAGCVRQQWAADDPEAPWNRPIPPAVTGEVQS